MSSPSSGTLTESDRGTTRGNRRRWLWLVLLFPLAIVAVLRWGALLLISSDPLPVEVDAAIVLQGSIAGQIARIRGAMALLKQGRAERMALSVPKESYWGEAVAPTARHYLEKNYGRDLASRVDFCETGPGVDSTEQEAAALSSCIHEHGWKTIAIVTSNYHSRRAGIIWRKTLPKQEPAVRLWIEGVPDPEFQPRGWWRERLSAKIWYMESTKLVWTCLFG